MLIFIYLGYLTLTMYSKEIFNKVKQMNNKGESFGNISTKLNIPKSTIQKIINPTHIMKYNHPGRPSVTNSSIKRKLKKLIRAENRIGNKVTYSQVRKSLNLDISLSSTKRARVSFAWASRRHTTPTG